MRERGTMSTVETATKANIFQAVKAFLSMFVNSDEEPASLENLEDLEDLKNLEDAELLPELKATVEGITAKAEKLNNRNQESKVKNNLKGLKENVQVAKGPTIQKADFHYNKENEEITSDKEISD